MNNINVFKNKLRKFIKSLNIDRTLIEQNGFEKDLIKKIANEGYLGCNIPKIYGGSELDSREIGLINLEFSKISPSLRSIFTVQGMFSEAILRWGTEEQKKKYLPLLASGEKIGAIALSEKNVGSDINNLESTYKVENSFVFVNGKKEWITFGAIADYYLTFLKSDNTHSAFIIDTNSQPSSLIIENQYNSLALKGTKIADVEFVNYKLAYSNLLGQEGIALKYIAPYILDYGRFTISFGCLGIAEACLDLVLKYTNERKQFSSKLNEFQAIQKIITEIITKYETCRLLCYSAANSRDNKNYDSIIKNCLAKYYSSKIVNQITSDAIQVLGSKGFDNTYPLEMYFRDAKAYEIIEGTSQILETLISKNFILNDTNI